MNGPVCFFLSFMKKLSKRFSFRSKLFCAECGTPLHRVKTKHNVTYVCDAFARKLGTCDGGTRVLEGNVKNAFITVLNKLAFSQGLAPGSRIIDLYINSIRVREREKNKARLEARSCSTGTQAASRLNSPALSPKSGARPAR